MSHNFSNTSQRRLGTCHMDLQKIMTAGIMYSNVDFGIAEGQRSLEKQQEYFRKEKSKLDGVIKKSKHQSVPSMAADIYLWINGKAEWREEDLSYVAGLLHGITEILYEQGNISHKIRWGGNWDMDGEILVDQSFDDRPHFELYKPQL